MGGSSIINSGGNYGAITIPSLANNPPARFENNGSWTDNNDNLWLFGGGGVNGNYFSDMWKYNPQINEWAWMEGPSSVNHPAVYGNFGIPNPTIYPRWQMGLCQMERD